MDHEMTLKLSAASAAAELEHYHKQSGGRRLQPELHLQQTKSDLIEFWIADAESRSSISFRPLSQDRCILGINHNETELWGWKLGERALGINTHLAAETSSACVQFCEGFVEYLNERRYVGPPVAPQTLGRPRDSDYDWARSEVHVKQRDMGEVFREWLERVGDERIKHLDDPWECFKKAMRKAPRGTKAGEGVKPM